MRQAASHPDCGSADVVLGFGRAGVFCVKIASINKYLIPVLSLSFLTLKNAKWGV